MTSYTDKSRKDYDQSEDADFGLVSGQGNRIGRQVDFGMTSSLYARMNDLPIYLQEVVCERYVVLNGSTVPSSLVETIMCGDTSLGVPINARKNEINNIKGSSERRCTYEWAHQPSWRSLQACIIK